MPRTILKTVFAFDELSETAKERARSWWRESDTMDGSDLLDRDDFEAIAEILGIEFYQKPVKLMGGGTRYESTIYFSGFSSQGDGACFEGRYRYAKGAPKKIREYAPQDATLHAIADQLQDVQRRNFYRLEAIVKHSGRYNHEFSTTIDVYDRENNYRDLDADDENVADLLRDFMRWIYRQLEAEYEYRMGDENVDESIRINEYGFDEDGRIV